MPGLWGKNAPATWNQVPLRKGQHPPNSSWTPSKDYKGQWKASWSGSPPSRMPVPVPARRHPPRIIYQSTRGPGTRTSSQPGSQRRSRTSGWTRTKRQPRTPPREVRTFTPHVNPAVHGPLKTSSSGMSTGLISGSTKVPLVNLPHTTTYPCPNSWRGTYVNCLLRHNTADNNKDHMLRHLQDLMHDATMYPWRNVRNFHGIVLGMMEQGELKWDDTSTIQQLRQQYTRIPHVPTVPITPDLTPCTKYQTGQCTQAGPHDKLAHICAWCYRYKGKAFGHPQSECMSKDQREKNSDGGN